MDIVDMDVPGGVVAGVCGTDLALLKSVLIVRGCPCWMAEGAGAPHSYELPVWPILIMLEALVGGVGKVWALSSPGLPDDGCGAIECGG